MTAISYQTRFQISVENTSIEILVSNGYVHEVEINDARYLSSANVAVSGGTAWRRLLLLAKRINEVEPLVNAAVEETKRNHERDKERRK